MNVAQSIQNYYEHEDFKGNYIFALMENIDTEQAVNRIIEIISMEYYTYRPTNTALILTNEQALEVLEYVIDNIDLFIRDMNNYYVGSSSIDSISFGEQEEQLEGLWNSRTRQPYSLKYLKHIFDQEGYYISGEYAYYDLSSSGVYIELFNAEIPLLQKLIDEYKQS